VQPANQRFDGITLEIIWSRLIAVVDEMAATLVRTSFSTVVRESNDYACVLLDADGNSMAQSTESIPSFIGTIPRTVKHFIKVHPPETLSPGDVIFTNNPWLASGHLPDFTMAAPVFKDGKIVAYVASTAHNPDVGGRLRSADSREVFEEGILMPPLKFVRAGEPDATIRTILANNVRVPSLSLGDLDAQVTAGEGAAKTLIKLMAEYGLDDLRELAAEIHRRSENAMRDAIRAIPDGEYRAQVIGDGFPEPVKICLSLKVQGDEIFADYTGTSPQVAMALNSVMNYTSAYTIYPIKCAINPATPNNEGSGRPITVTAPEGSILNPRFPAAVGGRAMTGHFLHAVVFTALSQAVPHLTQAESYSPLWGITLTGVDAEGTKWAHISFFNGGMGGAPHQDGLQTMSFPSNVSNTPMEVVEQDAPVLFHEKSLLPGSGGPGKFRGGLGQRIVIELTNPSPITATFLADRTKIPPQGILGGKAGRAGQLLVNGEPTDPKSQKLFQPGDVLTLELPGGGGFGDPLERDRRLVEADLREGRITREQARTVYGLDI
jgi:N-methylhydantoinase B